MLIQKGLRKNIDLRPVAVSDVSPNVFEKTTLKHVRIQCKTNDKQFGFKKKSSCTYSS